MYIEITKLNPHNPLNGTFFRFIAFDTTLVLEDYHQFSRLSKKHKQINDAKYCRLSERNSDLREIDIIIPEDVKQEAYDKFVAMIKICKWSEYKK